MTLTSDAYAVANFVRAVVEGPAPDPFMSTCIGWTNKGSVVAGVIYEYFTGASITATIAKTPESMLPPGFVRSIFRYPFDQLHVKKIIAYVMESNQKSIELLKKMGFVTEGRVTDAYPDGDMIIYTMTRPQCRWLGEQNG